MPPSSDRAVTPSRTGRQIATLTAIAPRRSAGALWVERIMAGKLRGSVGHGHLGRTGQRHRREYPVLGNPLVRHGDDHIVRGRDPGGTVPPWGVALVPRDGASEPGLVEGEGTGLDCVLVHAVRVSGRQLAVHVLVRAADAGVPGPFAGQVRDLVVPEDA